MATDAAGNALASWTATDGLGAKSVAAAAFQASAPQLSEVSVPASGTAGGSSPSPPGRSTFATIAQTSWDFGDGYAGCRRGRRQPRVREAGTYTVTVTATDSAGNATQATRQVTIAAAPGTPPRAAPDRRRERTPASRPRSCARASAARRRASSRWRAEHAR